MCGPRIARPVPHHIGAPWLTAVGHASLDCRHGDARQQRTRPPRCRDRFAPRPVQGIVRRHDALNQSGRVQGPVRRQASRSCDQDPDRSYRHCGERISAQIVRPRRTDSGTNAGRSRHQKAFDVSLLRRVYRCSRCSSLLARLSTRCWTASSIASGALCPTRPPRCESTGSCRHVKHS